MFTSSGGVYKVARLRRPPKFIRMVTMENQTITKAYHDVRQGDSDDTDIYHDVHQGEPKFFMMFTKENEGGKIDETSEVTRTERSGKLLDAEEAALGKHTKEDGTISRQFAF